MLKIFNRLIFLLVFAVYPMSLFSAQKSPHTIVEALNKPSVDSDKKNNPSQLQEFIVNQAANGIILANAVLPFLILRPTGLFRYIDQYEDKYSEHRKQGRYLFASVDSFFNWAFLFTSLAFTDFCPIKIEFRDSLHDFTIQYAIRALRSLLKTPLVYYVSNRAIKKLSDYSCDPTFQAKKLSYLKKASLAGFTIDLAIPFAKNRAYFRRNLEPICKYLFQANMQNLVSATELIEGNQPVLSPSLIHYLQKRSYKKVVDQINANSDTVWHVPLPVFSIIPTRYHGTSGGSFLAALKKYLLVEGIKQIRKRVLTENRRDGHTQIVPDVAELILSFLAPAEPLAIPQLPSLPLQ